MSQVRLGSNTRCCCITGEIRGQTATSSDGLRTAGEPGDLRAADLAPSRVQRPFEVSRCAALALGGAARSRGLNPGVFFLPSKAEPSGARISDMKQNHRNGLRAESASLWSVHMQRRSDQNHFTGAERDEGRVVKRGTVECPCSIWATVHCTVIEHNWRTHLSTDEEHFKQPGRGEGRETKGGMKSKTLGWKHGQEINEGGRKKSGTERKKTNTLGELKGRPRE